jgi:hypothetical protein
MQTPKNIQELREILLTEIDAVRKDPRRVNQAKEVINGCGKVLAGLRTEMEYSFLKGEEPEIPFMGPTSGKLLKPGARLLTAG